MTKPISDELLEHLQQHRQRTLQPPPEGQWQEDEGQWSDAEPEEATEPQDGLTDA